MTTADVLSAMLRQLLYNLLSSDWDQLYISQNHRYYHHQLYDEISKSIRTLTTSIHSQFEKKLFMEDLPNVRKKRIALSV